MNRKKPQPNNKRALAKLPIQGVDIVNYPKWIANLSKRIAEQECYEETPQFETTRQAIAFARERYANLNSPIPETRLAALRGV